MLKSLFLWLDAHPGSYWIGVVAAGILLFARIWRAVGRDAHDRPATISWMDGVAMFLFVLAWRWPYLLVAYDYNPDESQMIAGALTLARDPVFWRSVDGGSSGPLNYYLMVPWHWVGAPLDYFTARLTCLLLTAGTLFACFRTLTRSFGPAVAWLGVLPGVAFFATVANAELTNLSTEHLPLLLMAVAAGLIAGEPTRGRLLAGSFVAGALPWSKLQSTPLGVVLIGWAAWQALRTPASAAPGRWRRLGEVVFAASLPTLLFAGFAVATGQLEAMWRRYFLANLFYASKGENDTIREAMGQMWHHAGNDGAFPLFFGIALTGLVTAAGYLAYRRVRPSALVLASGILTLVAVAVVAAPRRAYLHYLLLVTVPLILWTGAVLGCCWRTLLAARLRLALAGVVAAAGLLPLVLRGWQTPPPVYGGFMHHWRYPRSPTGTLLHVLADRNATLGIWGWACFLHVETGLPQATRDATTLWSIQDNPQKAYHREMYLADLQRHAPDFFVDAVGPGAFMLTVRAFAAHETFPELAAYIRQHYTLLVDLQSERVYVRNGLTAARDLGREKLWAIIGRGRTPDRLSVSMPEILVGNLQEKVVAGRRVMMALPPVQLEWPLDAAVREVSLEFGYDPVAYEQGKSNGAEISLEVVGPDTTTPVFQRFLDPAHRAADRGPQRARETLPPFQPGSRLVLRTEPGPYEDTAWDWVYLARLRLHRETDPD